MGDSAELVNIRRLLEGQVNTYYAVGTPAAITANTLQDFDVYGNTALDVNATDIPDGDVMLWRALALVSVASAAPVTITWQVFEAANGVGAVTPMITTQLLPTTLTSGEVTARILVPFRRTTRPGGTYGHLFVRATADRDIENFWPYLFFNANAPRRLVHTTVP